MRRTMLTPQQRAMLARLALGPENVPTDGIHARAWQRTCASLVKLGLASRIGWQFMSGQVPQAAITTAGLERLESER